MTATPSASTGAFKERREEFMKGIQGGAALFASAPTAVRNMDVEFEYRQDSDLYYLTGFEEPSCLAVLVPDHPQHRFVMFVQPRDDSAEVWTGKRAGVEGAISDYGADAAFTIDKLDQELPGLLAKADRIYYRFGANSDADSRVVRLMRYFQRERQRKGAGPAAVIDPAGLLHEARLVKSASELETLRRAVDITCKGHAAARSVIKPGVYEYEIDAELRYVYAKYGSPRHAFPPIVASGVNSTTLHYTSNRRQLQKGELLLIDSGAEYGYFAGDVTRTYPADGVFSKEQAALYELVLAAEEAGIEAVRPGARFVDPHNRAVQILTEGLVRLGLLKGEVSSLIEKEEFKRFYMHRTSHWLGMDVHDVGMYTIGDESRKLEPGMVLTIEPGLYVSAYDQQVEPRYRGIGIRIEDDVLVTADGRDVLSSGLPRAISDIERTMRV